MKLLSVLNRNSVMGLFLLLTGSLICSLTMFEYKWDFTNYHYYNAFAFLHNRLNYDIVPSSINTFFNPLIDMPYYWLVETFNDRPEIASAFQGIWFGALLFAFYKISTLFFDVETWKGYAASLISVAIAATGQAVWYQAGSSTNEIQIGVFALISFYILFKEIKFPEYQKKRHFITAGLLLGIALGLKSTVIYICLSSGLSLIVCAKYLKRPVLFIALFAIGGITGYLITNGWWMYKMWQLYDNPFFPFLNGIFHSPYFDDFNFSDRRFIPPLSKAFIFPYIWYSGKYRSAEVDFYDFHGAVFYTLALCFIFYMVFHPRKLAVFYRQNRLWCFYTVLLLISYLLWLMFFAIYRYLLVTEMLAALFFVKFIFSYRPSSTVGLIVYATVAVILCGILLLNPKEGAGWGTRKWDKKIIEMETVNLPPNTLLKLYNFPTAGVIPVLAKRHDFRALGYMHLNAKPMQGSDFVERGEFRKIRDEIEREHKGEVVVIFRDLHPLNPRREMLMEAIEKDRKGKYCRKLKNNMDGLISICVSEKMKDKILPKGENK